MTKEQIEKVEKIVNGKIKENLPISWQEMDLEEAKLSGAIGLFGHKYEDKVKVYDIGKSAKPFSKEICMGPHRHFHRRPRPLQNRQRRSGLGGSAKNQGDFRVNLFSNLVLDYSKILLNTKFVRLFFSIQADFNRLILRR